MIHLLHALRAVLLKVAEVYDCYLIMLISMLTKALQVSFSNNYAFLAGYLAGDKNTIVNISVDINLEK